MTQGFYESTLYEYTYDMKTTWLRIFSIDGLGFSVLQKHLNDKRVVDHNLLHDVSWEKWNKYIKRYWTSFFFIKSCYVQLYIISVNIRDTMYM